MVVNIVLDTKLLYFLQCLSELINEKKVWDCFKNGTSPPSTIILIMDIGSLLYDTAFLGMEGIPNSISSYIVPLYFRILFSG